MYYGKRDLFLRGLSTIEGARAHLDGGLFSHVIANVCTFVACPVRDIAAIRKETCGSLEVVCQREIMRED